MHYPATMEGQQPGVSAPGSSNKNLQVAILGGQPSVHTPSTTSALRDGALPLPHIPDHELVRRIGHGAYGEVWLARTALGAYRAVKIVYRAAFDEDRPYEREFEGIRNFEPVSRSHESQVDILHVGRGDGHFYYVMELADDGSPPRREPVTFPDKQTPREADALNRIPDGIQNYVPRTLKHDLQHRGRLPPAECLQIGLALTTALGYLHQHRLVHRDVKPSNIIFIRGVPKLADIGLVTETDRTLSFVGTEGYIAPEGPGTPQADLYSLGKVLYEISTGKDRHEFPALPPELRSLPESHELVELNAIIVKACTREPIDRYHSAEQMHAELELLQRGKSVKRRRLTERWRTVAWKGGQVAASVAVLTGLFWLAIDDLRQTKDTTNKTAVPPAMNSIFILPFRNAGTNGIEDDLRGRITDAFIDALPLIPGVRTGPRKSGWVHRDEDELRHALAKTNEMSHHLTGQISGGGNTLALTLRLLPRHSDRPLWTEKLSGTTNEVVALVWQGIARIASVLGLKIAESEHWRIAQKLTNNLQALRWYREARAVYSRKAGTQVGYIEVRKLAQKAKALDPNYLDADYFDAYMIRNLAQDRSPTETWPDLEDRMNVILSKDDTYAAALSQRAGCALFYHWNWEDYDAFGDRELQFLAGTEWHFMRAWRYRIYGRMAAARAEQEKSEQPEPIDSDQRFIMVTSRWATGYYDEGIQIAHRTLERYPDHAEAYAVLAHCLVAKGDFVRGIMAIDQAQKVWKKQEFTALLGYAYARMGQPTKARQVLEELLALKRTSPYLQPYFVARVYAALGENEKALDWLETTAEDRSEYLFIPDWGGLRTDPAWKDLQEEPRYWELCKRVGLGKNQWPR